MGTRSLQQLYAAFLVTEAEWGRDDCALAAADVSLAITGIDPLAAIRGEWKNKRQAIRFRVRFSKDIGEAMRQIAEDVCGLKPIDPAQASPGDMGTVRVFDPEMKQTIEVAACRVSNGWFVRTAKGYGRVFDAVRAWKV